MKKTLVLVLVLTLVLGCVGAVAEEPVKSPSSAAQAGAAEASRAV